MRMTLNLMDLLGEYGMRKFICLMILIFCTFDLFAQEPDNRYWYEERDVEGNLFTLYKCKTDAQFNKTFKYLVREQLGIYNEFFEPNWYSIQKGWVSEESLRKNFPNVCKNFLWIELDWDDFKYYWSIENFYDGYLVILYKRVGDIDYMTFNHYDNGFWEYTPEFLCHLEMLLELATAKKIN